MYYTQKQEPEAIKKQKQLSCSSCQETDKMFRLTTAKIDMDYVDLNCNENGQRSFGFNIGISHSDERLPEKKNQFSSCTWAIQGTRTHHRPEIH